MKLPVEILERIFLNCDGKTLKAATEVEPKWKDIIKYLSEKTHIWKWCCSEEIPERELVDYLQNYNASDKYKWQKIYENWLSWQNVQENIRCDIIPSPIEIPRISCCQVSGNKIAVGSDDGRIRLFTENWKLLYMARHKTGKVTNLSFIVIGDKIDMNDFFLVIAYARCLVIEHFNGKTNNQMILEDIKDHSVYKNYICYEKIRGRISIVKLNKNANQLMEIWFSRIYSPSYPTCINIWNGVCTILINSEVQTVRYDSDATPPISGLEKLTMLKSSLDENEERTFRILRDNIVISIHKTDAFSRDEFFEFFILGPKGEYSQKLFNTWEVLGAFITCIFVYGHTLVLGVDCGTVYFYHVPCWKNFDIRDYQQKLIIGQHPIISIAVKETKNERKFYISSNFSIHEVVGFDPKNDYLY